MSASASELESLRNRLDSLNKRAGESTVLASMLNNRLARQVIEISEARTALQQLTTRAIPSFDGDGYNGSGDGSSLADSDF